MKCRDVIFHEHILDHPEIVREPIAIDRLITGLDRTANVEGEEDGVEELYPIIAEIKPID